MKSERDNLLLGIPTKQDTIFIPSGREKLIQFGNTLCYLFHTATGPLILHWFTLPLQFVVWVLLWGISQVWVAVVQKKNHSIPDVEQCPYSKCVLNIWFHTYSLLFVLLLVLFSRLHFKCDAHFRCQFTSCIWSKPKSKVKPWRKN